MVAAAIFFSSTVFPVVSKPDDCDVRSVKWVRRADILMYKRYQVLRRATHPKNSSGEIFVVALVLLLQPPEAKLRVSFTGWDMAYNPDHYLVHMY